MDREQMSINELTVGNIIGGGILNPFKKTIYLNGAVGSDGIQQMCLMLLSRLKHLPMPIIP